MTNGKVLEVVWSPRAYKEEDENKIFELVKAVHPEITYDKKEWIKRREWEYDNPAGNPITWLADHDGKLAGYYAIMPVMMKVGDETIVGSQSVDTMTHPKYRRQGIFETLANKTYTRAGEVGVSIVYGFPNKYSYPGFVKKLDWFDISPIQTAIKPLNTKNILTKYIKSNLLLKIGEVIGTFTINLFYMTKKPPEVDGLTITKIESFDDRINDFWAEFSKDYDVLVTRTKERLNWRYVNPPNKEYTIYLAERDEKICGYMVLGCRETRNLLSGYILDLVVPLNKIEILHCLVSRAIAEFKESGADIIFFTMIGDNRYYKILKRNGFIFSRFIIKRSRFIARVNTDKISKSYLEDSNHWFVQLGDSDFV